MNTPPASEVPPASGMRERLVRYHAKPDLTAERAGARISAYVYGNIIIFAAILGLPTHDVENGDAFAVVVGAALTTFLAHAFAEVVGHSTRDNTPEAKAELGRELRDAAPIATSAVLPALLLALAWAGWFSGGAMALASEIYLLVRIALIPLMVERLRTDRTSFPALLAGILLALAAAAVSAVKMIAGH
ncbi:MULTISPECIES: hypothetical protein [Streptacidiphilus]|uniref:Integral membrane protein n=1 Tax=Streptacidiphilus cavernicola TaxID=3342716 RepID=A0ABV6UZV7_9ACTN|nr:hypothetical protein [Streptacidiphilus jeojiense]